MSVLVYQIRKIFYKNNLVLFEYNTTKYMPIF